jgi:hypothetical protein
MIIPLPCVGRFLPWARVQEAQALPAYTSLRFPNRTWTRVTEAITKASDLIDQVFTLLIIHKSVVCHELLLLFEKRSVALTKQRPH